MSHSYKVISATKEHLIADKSDFLEVSAEIFLNGESKEVKKFAYPLTATKEEITADLDKFVETQDLEMKQAADNAEHEEIQKQADATIAALVPPTSKKT